jgi:hypothetical protein
MSPTLAATLGAVRSVCVVVGLPFAPLGFPSPGTARKAAGYRLYDR